MQQRGQGVGGAEDVPFSILNRIGGDATIFPAPPATGPAAPFSILNRIGGDATPRRFQYP